MWKFEVSPKLVVVEAITAALDETLTRSPIRAESAANYPYSLADALGGEVICWRRWRARTVTFSWESKIAEDA
jgi:hypothetical protein